MSADLLEHYRSNNYDLAMALNEVKMDLDTLNRRLLDKENELQKSHDENICLKNELEQRNNQLSTWRAMFVDLIQSNTRKYTEVMQKIGLSSNGVNNNKPNNDNILQTQTNTSKQQQQSVPLREQSRPHAHRRRNTSLDGLANLTEESLHSLSNVSNSSTPTFSPSERKLSNVTARRRSSNPLSSPPKVRFEPATEKNPAEAKRKSKVMSKISEIGNENTPQNSKGKAKGKEKEKEKERPSRRTAPKNLAEPKLGTKLRRN